MRVLVLGGTRFVGPFAVDALVDAGHEVAVFHSGRTEPDLPSSVRHVHGEFDAVADYLDELRAFEPAVVVDTVPFIDKAGHGVAHFADTGARGVVLTSGDVYRAFARLLGSEPGPPDPIPLTEDSPLRAEPSPDLGIEIDFDNLDIERAVSALPLSVTVLRLSVVYGPNDPYNRLGGYLKRMDDGRPAIVLEEPMARWHWSREYAGNVGAAIAHVVGDERSAGRTYNVAPEQTLNEREWVEAIAGVVGWRGEIVVVPSAELPQKMQAGVDLRQEIVMGSARIGQELGFTAPVPLENAIAATVDWARSVDGPQPDYEVEDAVLAAQSQA